MINTGDTGFIMICTTMIFFMTPALGMFYAGLLRKRSSVDIIVQCLISFSIVTLIWIIFGFSLAYGRGSTGFIGGLEYIFMAGVGVEPAKTIAPTIPLILFFGLQIMVAAITPALVAGATAERISLKGYIGFTVLWSIFVYLPICYWVWGGGMLARFGFADFAGGTVVHISAGFSALVAAKAMGKRESQDNRASNMGFVVISLGILWFGWLAFNGGSALGANGRAALAVVNSHISASVGLLCWLILTYRAEKRASLMSIVMGALGGLVVITPGAGYVTPICAIVIGAIGSTICFYAIKYRPLTGIDDTLDVFGLHGVGGFVGVIFVGIFANPELSGVTGLVYGGGKQVLIQLLGGVVVAAYATVATFIIFKVLKKSMAVRLSAKQESNIDMEVYREQIIEE